MDKKNRRKYINLYVCVCASSLHIAFLGHVRCNLLLSSHVNVLYLKWKKNLLKAFDIAMFDNFFGKHHHPHSRQQRYKMQICHNL